MLLRMGAWGMGHAMRMSVVARVLWMAVWRVSVRLLGSLGHLVRSKARVWPADHVSIARRRPRAHLRLWGVLAGVVRNDAISDRRRGGSGMSHMRIGRLALHVRRKRGVVRHLLFHVAFSFFSAFVILIIVAFAHEILGPFVLVCASIVLEPCYRLVDISGGEFI